MALAVRAGGWGTFPSKDPDSRKNYTVNLASYLGTDTVSTADVVPTTGMVVTGVTTSTSTISFWIEAGATLGYHILEITWNTTSGVANETIAMKLQVTEAQNALN